MSRLDVALFVSCLVAACGSESERAFHCTKEAAALGRIRVCGAAQVSEPTFQRNEAHCFTRGRGMACTPTEDECLELMHWAQQNKEAVGACHVTKPDEWIATPRS